MHDFVSHTLQPHPQGQHASLIDELCVELRRDVQTLHIEFRISGQTDRIQLPPATRPRVRHGLWKQTCCELFIATRGEAACQEFNLSPGGEWAAWHFSGYRQGMQAMDIADPQIRLQQTPGQIRLLAELATAALPREPWEINLSAVIEAAPTDDQSGDRAESAISWWALAHSTKYADFHLRDNYRILWP